MGEQILMSLTSAPPRTAEFIMLPATTDPNGRQHPLATPTSLSNNYQPTPQNVTGSQIPVVTELPQGIQQFMYVPPLNGTFRPTMCYMPMMILTPQGTPAETAYLGIPGNQIEHQGSTVGVQQPTNVSMTPANFYLIQQSRGAESLSRSARAVGHLFYYPPNQGPLVLRPAIPAAPVYSQRLVNAPSEARNPSSLEPGSQFLTPPSPLHPAPSSLPKLDLPQVEANRERSPAPLNLKDAFASRIPPPESPRGPFELRNSDGPAELKINPNLNSSVSQNAFDKKPELAGLAGFQLVKRKSVTSETTEDILAIKNHEASLPPVLPLTASNTDVFYDPPTQKQLIISNDSGPSVTKFYIKARPSARNGQGEDQEGATQAFDAHPSYVAAQRHFQELMKSPEVWKNKIDVRIINLQHLLRAVYLCEDPVAVEDILHDCRCLPFDTILNFRKFYAKNLKISNNFSKSVVARMTSGPFVFESKRHEEHIKYTLNWCFKYLQNLRNVQNDDEFYTFYFKEVCEKKGVGLDKFIKPTFTKNSIISTRSFKREYIHRLMESESFMKDAHEAFSEHFHKNQRLLIQRKIDKIFGKLQAFMLKMGATDDHMEVKIAKFLNIFNLQFPWTILQALEALESIRKVLFMKGIAGHV